MINIIAHRGLWNEKVKENTIEAFQRAIDEKLDIELDVQLSKDKRVVVYHDETLKRLHNIDAKIKDLTFQKLAKYDIPLLEDVLKLVDGQVYLDIEIKYYHAIFETTRKTALILRNYKYNYSIKSFHPLIPIYYKRLSPNTKCGLLIGHYPKYWPKALKNYFYNLRFLSIYHPDFISYSLLNFNHTIYQKLLEHKIPFSLYTIRTEANLKLAKQYTSSLIVEKIYPIKKTSK